MAITIINVLVYSDGSLQLPAGNTDQLLSVYSKNRGKLTNHILLGPGGDLSVWLLQSEAVKAVRKPERGGIIQLNIA